MIADSPIRLRYACVIKYLRHFDQAQVVMLIELGVYIEQLKFHQSQMLYFRPSVVAGSCY